MTAGQEEQNLAIQSNKYPTKTPVITVIVDRGWSKRSHKHSSNANLGMGQTPYTSQENLRCICNEYLQSLQVTTTEASINQINPPTVYGSSCEDHS